MESLRFNPVAAWRAWRLRRLHRSLAYKLAFIEECLDRGTKVVAEAENDTPIGRTSRFLLENVGIAVSGDAVMRRMERNAKEKQCNH